MRFSQSSAVYFNHSIKYAIQNLHDLGYKGIEILGGVGLICTVATLMNKWKKLPLSFRPDVYCNIFDDKWK